MSSTNKVVKTAVGDMPVALTDQQIRLHYQRRASAVQILQNCLNCVHWQKGDATKPQGCSKYRQLPPPDVIVHGCEQHDFDVPF
ncbi:hypothetical protein [Achromobacter phage nyashin_LB6]|nr:hypothetical protein [Achromobacter phage nyashin_LB6]